MIKHGLALIVELIIKCNFQSFGLFFFLNSDNTIRLFSCLIVMILIIIDMDYIFCLTVCMYSICIFMI